jgi:TatD DNase family protein
MGIHPCSIGAHNEEALVQVEQLLRTGRYCAVGEIGIDLYWDRTHLVQQQDAFRRQVRLAKALDLPIAIHCRNSFAETIAIVEEENGPALRGVFHCFTGTPVEAQRIIALGDFHLGIGGVITYPKGGLFETMQQVGPAHCVLETDAPYLAPVPFRGKRNESAYIPYIAERLALACGTTVQHIAEVTTTNAHALFRR